MTSFTVSGQDAQNAGKGVTLANAPNHVVGMVASGDQTVNADNATIKLTPDPVAMKQAQAVAESNKTKLTNSQPKAVVTNGRPAPATLSAGRPLDAGLDRYAAMVARRAPGRAQTAMALKAQTSATSPAAKNQPAPKAPEATAAPASPTMTQTVSLGDNHPRVVAARQNSMMRAGLKVATAGIIHVAAAAVAGPAAAMVADAAAIIPNAPAPAAARPMRRPLQQYALA